MRKVLLAGLILFSCASVCFPCSPPPVHQKSLNRISPDTIIRTVTYLDPMQGGPVIDTLLFSDFITGIKTLYENNSHVFIGKIIDARYGEVLGDETLYVKTEKIFKNSKSLITSLMFAPRQYFSGSCQSAAVSLIGAVYLGAFNDTPDPIRYLNQNFIISNNYFITNDSVCNSRYEGFTFPVTSLDSLFGSQTAHISKRTSEFPHSSHKTSGFYDIRGRKVKKSAHLNNAIYFTQEGKVRLFDHR